jgi:hypothetical protein
MALCPFGTSVKMYKSTRRNKPEDFSIHPQLISSLHVPGCFTSSSHFAEHDTNLVLLNTAAQSSWNSSYSKDSGYGFSKGQGRGSLAHRLKRAA